MADVFIFLAFSIAISVVFIIRKAKNEIPIDTISILIVCSTENTLITNPDMAAPRIVLIEFTKPRTLKAPSIFFPLYIFGMMLEPIG